MEQVAEMESNGNPRARSTSSSAAGLYQFTTPTWAGLRARYPSAGLTDRLNPEQQHRAMRLFTSENASLLARVLGRAPDEGELYLAHLLGSLGATRVLLAPAKTPLVALVGAGTVHANSFLRRMTAGDMRAYSADRFGGRPPLGRARGGPGRRPITPTESLNAAELQRIRKE
jgi:hypothetical protein